MSQTHTDHAKPQPTEDKKHGDALENAMQDADRHNTEGAKADPVPAPDQGTHSHSHSAHLDEIKNAEAAYEGQVRQGSNPSILRQPPSYQERAGKSTKGN